MARFYGEVGYGNSVENPPNSGIWVNQITEYVYQGDIIRNIALQGTVMQANSDMHISNSISIVADEFANANFYNIKYVRWAGVLWTVMSVEVRPPRLILNLGMVYNGPTA